MVSSIGFVEDELLEFMHYGIRTSRPELHDDINVN